MIYAGDKEIPSWRTANKPCAEDTISRETLDCRRERDGSRPVFDLLLFRIDAKKSSFVAPAGRLFLPDGPYTIMSPLNHKFNRRDKHKGPYQLCQEFHGQDHLAGDQQQWLALCDQGTEGLPPIATRLGAIVAQLHGYTLSEGLVCNLDLLLELNRG